MVKKEYRCNLCVDAGDSASLQGVHWQYDAEVRRDAIAEYPMHQTDCHLCRKCIDDIYRMTARRIGKTDPDAVPPTRALWLLATMIRDAARKYVDKPLQSHADEFDRMIGIFNLPEAEMIARVIYEVEAPKCAS